MTLKDLASTSKKPTNRCVTCWILTELPEGGDNGASALREALASAAPSSAISTELLTLGYSVSSDSVGHHRKRQHQ